MTDQTAFLNAVADAFDAVNKAKDAALAAGQPTFVAEKLNDAARLLWQLEKHAAELAVKAQLEADAARPVLSTVPTRIVCQNTWPTAEDADDSCPECHADWKRPDPDCPRCGR